MSEPQDIVDVTFDKTAAWYERFLNRGMAEKWFQWVEWVTLTAALWAVAEKSGSVLVRLIAFFSSGVVFFAAWFSTEKAINELLPSPSKLPKFVVAVLTFSFALIPFAVMHFIAEVIESLL